MRKATRVLTMVVVGMLAVVGVASAHIPDEEIVISGVEPGSSMEYVGDIYGSATKAWHYTQGMTEYSYGDSLKFYVWDKTNTVQIIHVYADNGFKTAAGFHVGNTMKEVEDYYGKPDETHKERYDSFEPLKEYKGQYLTVNIYRSVDEKGWTNRWLTFVEEKGHGRVVAMFAGLGGDD